MTHTRDGRLQLTTISRNNAVDLRHVCVTQSKPFNLENAAYYK